jgi:Putative quorum-sensing-regulated virulence factor
MQTMPFGKHRGSAIADLPTDYLDWLVHDCEIKNPRLRQALEAEWSRRQGGGQEQRHEERQHHGQEQRNGNGAGGRNDKPPPPPPPPPPLLKDAIKQIVDVGFRQLAVKAHPDRGGQHLDMVQLNRARDWLRKHLA